MMPSAPYSIFVRAIDLRECDGNVRCALEDNIHRMHLDLRVEAGVIVAVDAVLERHPYTTCPGSVAGLRALVGRRPPIHVALDREERVDTCLHLLDMAALAIAHHARGPGAHRRYEAHVESTPAELAVYATLLRDGDPVLDWRMSSGTILAPAAYEGVALAAMARWATDHVADAGEGEAARVLARAAFIGGNATDFGSFVRLGTAAAIAAVPSCYSMKQGADAVIVDSYRHYARSNVLLETS